MTFNYELSLNEQDLAKHFLALCRMNRLSQFSSDDFRMYGLDRFMKDPQHEVGSLFAKMQHARMIKPVGRKRSVLESNHIREIRVYTEAERHFRLEARE